MSDKNIELMEFEDIRDEIEGVFNQVALFKTDGTQMMPFNNPKIKVSDRLDAVEKRLDSKSTPNGVYIIKARYHQRDHAPAPFYFAKGDISNVTLSDQPTPAPLPAAKPISTDKAIEITSTNARLEAEIKHLKSENKILAEENAALKEQVEEYEQDLGDGGGEPNVNQEFWSNLAENMVPILEKHYEHKGNELQFKREQLAAQLMQPQNRQPQQPPGNAPNNTPNGHNGQQSGQVPEIEQFRGWLDDHDIAQLYQMKQNAPQTYPMAIEKLTARFNQEQAEGGEHELE